ncbi:LytR/AlgR family response regulator transcription factor [Arcicella lustrica]|uniref:LytTR family DNA-binding domain-containing protein n=1 Tax=Arcicella lustrica TaxID=2984196 RepID=A0ABU5SKX4_9BACT|nr:LytTR family DNA-binding domain-containing protein [Arcicella sp. DC25W]MEA5427945.1 LytTR family DNA-binding domain-containing protein [Arcicella sp. DC25W]
MKIRCILIDDEPFALNILEDDLLDFVNIEILEKFNSPEDVPDFLQKNEVDLIFSDIQMPEMLGTQFIKTLENPPLVIFTTAYHQYALEGFELNAVDYLMKPIRKERLAIALKKVEDQLRLREKLSEENEEDYIFISVEYQKVKLFFSEIIYIEGLKDYVKIYLMNRAYPLMTRSNLRGMEAKLPEKHFVRIHNSYIINKQKITGFHQSKISLSKIELPVGKKYVASIKSLSE